MSTPLPIRGVSEIERRGLRDRVYDLILAMLLEGEVEPQSRLSIDTLAKQLDVSPTPVREAMVQLERTGLVTREALKGYRVAPPLSSDQLAELFDARMMLELETTRRAVRHSADFVRQLRATHDDHARQVERVVRAMAKGTATVRVAQDYFAADAAFHKVIVDASGNRYLRAMHEDLGALTHRMRQAVIRGVNDVHEAHAEHEAVLQAFERGSETEAVRAMKAHIRGVRARSLLESTTG